MRSAPLLPSLLATLLAATTVVAQEPAPSGEPVLSDKAAERAAELEPPDPSAATPRAEDQPPLPPPPTCCRWSVRFDPFDIVYRRITLQAEVKVWGPLSLEFTPSFIFGAPQENVNAKGFALGLNLAYYPFSGKALQGMWIKAHGAYERYGVTLTHPDLADSSDSKTVSTAVFGFLIGNTTVFGRNGGFALSGGVGVGFATAGSILLSAPGDEKQGIPAHEVELLTKLDRVRLLGTLGLGVAF